MEKSENIVYFLYNSMYLNITNKCTNACDFCIRGKTDNINNTNLWLKREPDTEEIISAIRDPTPYEEVVFCGYGEPLIRLDTVIDVCKYLRKYKVPIRINTNGLANLIHKKNIIIGLISLVDCMSISLNAESAEKYDKLCHSKFGLNAFPAMLEFTKLCRDNFINVTLSVVDLPEIDLDACKKIAKELDVPLRIRQFLPKGYN